MNVKARLELLRSTMRERNLDAYLVPSQDPHQSEYVAEYWQGRAWLSIFPGLAIFFTVVGFNLLGDAIRDVLDPRLKNVS